jgi:hypothetical protein
MRTVRLTAALLGLLAATAALATPPDPPNLHYSGAFNRRVNFVWQSVPRVNWYELWQRPNDGAAWVKFATLPSGRVGVGSNVSAHLLNWEQVRYQLKACNPSGCGSSAELDSFDNQAIPAMVYIKPSRTQPGARFGSAVDLSEDGSTLVSVSRSETDTPTGRHAIVNIYLFAYPSAGGIWRQQTRLFPSVTQPNNGAGVVANLSGDGNVLIVGIPAERAAAATTSPEIGAVYLFRRTGTTWQQERRFAPPPDMTPAHYGFAAEISEDGNTIMIGRETDGGTAEVYKYADGAWTLAATVPGPGGAMGCNRIRLSGNGEAVVRTCTIPPFIKELHVFRGPAYGLELEDNIFSTDEAQLRDLAVDYRGETYVWSQVGAQRFVGYRQWVNGVTTRNNFHTPYWSCHDDNIAQSEFGGRVALSRDGQFFAVRDIRDTCAGTGPIPFSALRPGTKPTGAVYIYHWRNGGSGLRRIIKPNVAPPEGGWFEGELSFADNGHALVISQPGDRSGAFDPYHSQTDTSKPDAGGVLIY